MQAVLAYTSAGLFGAMAVGALLGYAGSWAGSRTEWAAFAVWGLPFLALMLAAREMGWLRFTLPERRLQTNRMWADEFGIIGAAAMWGFHIGLGFATRITYGGFWVIVAAIVIIGDVLFGVLLMGTYWLGRVLPVLLAPAALARGADSSARMGTQLFTDSWLYREIHAIGLLWSAGVGILIGLRIS